MESDIRVGITMVVKKLPTNNIIYITCRERERERTLFATQIETKNIKRYKSLHAWQVARKGITPIELAT